MISSDWYKQQYLDSIFVVIFVKLNNCLLLWNQGETAFILNDIKLRCDCFFSITKCRFMQEATDYSL